MNRQPRSPSPLRTEHSEDLLELTQVPKKLNWTSVLKDQNIFIDSELYRKWNRELKFEDQHLIDKDLTRTRSNEQYFKKPSTRMLLKRITTFYCMSNQVHYQQGLLEVVVPFALLRRRDFPTRKVYAYFNAFMRKYFPKVLLQKTMNNKNELPHAILAISLVQILLRYHLSDIYSLFKSEEVPLSMVVTQQILTVFARNLELPLVYQIFNFYINKKDKNYVLYLAIALIALKRDELKKSAENGQLHMFANKRLKTVEDKSELEEWFEKAEEVQRNTPKSFVFLSKELGFCDKQIFSFEEYQQMMKFDNSLIDSIMPVYPQEVEQKPQLYTFLLINGEIPSGKFSCIRLSIKPAEEGISINNMSAITSLGEARVLVIGCTREERKELEAVVGLIDRATSCRHRFMMWPDKLKPHRGCALI